MPNNGWLQKLISVVHRRPIVLFRFSEEEWGRLSGSRQGTSQFTFARSHEALEKVQAPTVCLLATREYGNSRNAHIGLLKSRAPITTIQSRLSIAGAQSIKPSCERALLGLIDNTRLNQIFSSFLESESSVVRLSPALSACLVKELAKQPLNRQAMRAIAAAFSAPSTYSTTKGVQKDAISLVLKAFGLSPAAPAGRLHLNDNQDTALEETNIREDFVIEHHARSIPGFSLADSDLTGRAIFRKDQEVLEVITANRGPLEEVLGVDLIYLNAIKHNIVMVQYKMLERESVGSGTSWIYRPDRRLEEQNSRMRRFSRSHAPQPSEYRINPQVYYLRFVRRHVRLGKSAITIPIDHFEKLRDDPDCRGPMGAFRISYDLLKGRYLRQEGFLELLRSGYIGAYAQTTEDLTTLINAILTGNRALVGAIHSSVQKES